MLKKAGIIVAAAAAGVLAVGTIAFADTSLEEGNLSNNCPISQEGSDVAQNLVGGDSLVAAAGAVTGAITSADTQLQTLNCTNVGLRDVIDFNSNNETETVTETEIDDSFNGAEIDD